MVSVQTGQRVYSKIERKANKRAWHRSRKNQVTRKRRAADRKRKRAMFLPRELKDT